LNTRNLFTVGLKLIGIYWLIETIFFVEAIAVAVLFSHETGTTLTGLDYALDAVKIGIQLAIFFLCSIKTELVVNQFKYQDAPESHEWPAQVAALLSAGLTIMGFYFLTTSTFAFAKESAKAFFITRQFIDITGRRVAPWSMLLPYFIQCIVSCLLILGSTQIARLWSALRALPDRLAKRVDSSQDEPT
jgi:hypothetical protein